MKLRLLSATIAATLLAGCSSSGSSDSSTPKSGVADVVYSESLNAAYIEGDQGNSAVIVGDGNGNAAVTVNGEVFTVQGDVIVDKNGDIVGGVVVENGVATAYVDGVAYSLSVEDGRLLVDINDIAPDFGDTPRWGPEFGDDSWGPESAPTYGDIDEVFGTTVITLDNGERVVVKDGVLYHPESDSGVVLNNDGTITNMDGEVIGTGDMTELGFVVTLDSGEEIIFRNDNGRLFAAIVSSGNGHIHWGPDAAPTYGDIDEVFGTTVITLDNGERVVVKDGVLYHPESDSGVVLNNDGTITNMDGEVIGSGEMTELGFVVQLENGVEVIFRNDNGRLFAAVLSESGHNHWGPDAAPTYGDIDEVLGTTVITLDNGERVVIKDGVLYHPESDSGVVLNNDGTITNMDGEVIGSGEMTEHGFVVQLENGAEIIFRNDNGRLFAAIISPVSPENDLPTLGFDLDGNQLTVTLLDGTEVIIQDNGVTGGVIIGPEGDTKLVSKATMDAYKEAAEVLSPEEQKSLVAVFLVNQSGDVINDEMRRALWKVQKESTVEWAKQSVENATKMVQIIAIEVDEIGQKPYSLGYYLLTGQKKGISELKGAARDKAVNMTEAQKAELRNKLQSLSQEQRQQIKQAIKSRVASRS
ncbi:hypothetical protein BCU83_15805 [Vibrio breoganii]|uniref:hypothetical protein n=1 Tax=Vibrio breoganii TaxID=553239 RepID=UPI000C849914|nr:hypothetical protein [Vibrio breoganii]PMG77075.1 hypothetical protein BCU83_15805 [Vibrio breoganii]